METDERIREAIEQTEVLKTPERLISTSESSTLHYYILVEPAYLDVLPEEGPETKIREGRVTWEQPRLLTPSYILSMEGFSDQARTALRMLAGRNPDLAGLLYRMKYRKDYEYTETVSSDIEETCAKIENRISGDEEELTAIIKGVDELWDVSLMTFIQDYIMQSAYHSQLPHYRQQGLITADENGYPIVTRTGGVPVAARREIEKMFKLVEKGEMEASELKKELDRWGVFRHYEKRFLNLFRKE